MLEPENTSTMLSGRTTSRNAGTFENQLQVDAIQSVDYMELVDRFTKEVPQKRNKSHRKGLKSPLRKRSNSSGRASKKRQTKK